MSRRPVDLVFEGGGVKGIGLAGAFSELWDRGYEARCVAGTSAGAITAALAAAGYTGQELGRSRRRDALRAFGNAKQQYLLQVVASDLTAHSMLVLPRDARLLGVEPDGLEIALAVRMSMSIPIFFDATIHPGADGRKHMIVDGGMLSNFPVWLFDAPAGQEPLVPTNTPINGAHSSSLY